MVATQELLESTSRTLIERLSSPLLGSLTIAWCLWNWQFLVVLFSDNSVVATFELVEQVVYPTSWTAAWKGLLAPLASALLYVFAYPYVARVVFSYLLKQQQKTNSARQRIEGETLLSREESQRILLRLRQQDRAHAEDRQLLLEEIQLLKAEADRKDGPEEQRGTPASDHSDARNFSVKEDQMRVVTILGDKDPQSLSAEYIAEVNRMRRIEVEHALGELVLQAIVSRKATAQGVRFALTHEGRGIYLEHQKARK